MNMANSPFSLGSDVIYQHWRDSKLDQYPTQLGDLVVELKRDQFAETSIIAAL